MNIYTYSEARQQLARVLDRAATDGKVLIRRRNGQTFALAPEPTPTSPLDIPSIQVDLSTPELIDLIRSGRERGDLNPTA